MKKITICGSIAFYDKMEEIKRLLEDAGHQVLIPELEKKAPREMGGGKKVYFGKYIRDNGGPEAFGPNHKIWTMKEDAIRDHYEKIEEGDCILVVNEEKRGAPGYIGGNTLMEIGLSFYLKKPIYILNDIHADLSHRDEILGMKPVFINGDLHKLND